MDPTTAPRAKSPRFPIPAASAIRNPTARVWRRMRRNGRRVLGGGGTFGTRLGVGLIRSNLYLELPATHFFNILLTVGFRESFELQEGLREPRHDAEKDAGDHHPIAPMKIALEQPSQA
jgi:hypothetical protein